MLENSEQIQGLDQIEILAKMVQELPWANLKAYVQANAQLLKACTVGGHRLDAKRRKRVEILVQREAEKAEYSQTFCSGLFAVWYPVHEELHKALEEYFHSDEYTKYKEENELEDEDYVLPDDVFTAQFVIEDLEKWRALLCFSPLKFSEKQAKTILDDSVGSPELLGRITELEESVADFDKRHARIEADNERLKERQKQSAAEAQEARKGLRQLKRENESLVKKLEVSLVDLKKVRQTAEDAEKEKTKQTQLVKTEVKKHGSRLQGDINRISKELAEWKNKYEGQRVENRQLLEEIEAAKRDVAAAFAKRDEALGEQNKMQSFAGLILQEIDWSKIGAQMKLTPTMRRQFNSLLKKLSYEDDNSLTIEGTLTEFWEGLISLEKQLIQNVAMSNTKEVMHGGIEAYWIELTDAFGDVKISLEARTILLTMLQEIFYQSLDVDALKKATIPKTSSKK